MTPADATELTVEDLRRTAEHFGVADEHVRRDHLISHVLAAISASDADDVIFFGGTALSRTHLARARLSEDIDLIGTTPRSEVLPRLVHAVEQSLMRTHGRPSWTPAFTDRDTAPLSSRRPECRCGCRSCAESTTRPGRSSELPWNSGTPTLHLRRSRPDTGLLLPDGRPRLGLRR